MNYLQPERLDRLAREYVLGTLTGAARRRFERLLRQTPAAMLAVSAWQERFSVLAAGVPPLQPREGVWQGLEHRLFPGARDAAPAPARPLQWLWNLLSAKTLAGALAGVLLCAVVLRVQPGLIGLETQTDALPASYVGLLLDTAGKPSLLANSRRHGRQLTVKVLQPVAVPAGQIAQLWAVTKDGDPFPVAALPPLPARGSITLTMPDTSEKLFSNVPRLVVTLQAAPAQPGDKPAVDPVLAGHCVKLW
ncbi:anti-sigma factor [Piscinibacter sp. XHJ-5]|uniref:anti-sigma factor n=1 Tax=Piscinibacter sp. XHJ-5 TaxID=3037797 RepID=UPI002452D93E|nr:anti-sigma factor [Piscinibacter sp. XHJ-5]